MSSIEYDHTVPTQFLGPVDEPATFDTAAALISSVAVRADDIACVAGTRNGPREILHASAQVEFWDEELGADIHNRGIFTMPEA